MEQNSSKTKRTRASHILAKTYIVKVDKPKNGKSKVPSENVNASELAQSKPPCPTKTGSHSPSDHKAKKSKGNPEIQIYNSIVHNKQTAKQSSSRNEENAYNDYGTPFRKQGSRDLPRTYSTPSTQASGNDSETLRKKTIEGFKVVRNGNILIDSLPSESESDTQNGSVSSGSEGNPSKYTRFATSQCNIGPSCNKISLPHFLVGY